MYTLTIGFVVFYLYLNNVDTKDVYPPLTYFLMFVGSWEFLRFNIEWVNWLYCYLLGPLMRPSEVKTRINGVIYYLLGKAALYSTLSISHSNQIIFLVGCIIVLYSFPRDIAALSIIYLSWTDPTASIFGKLWGKYTFQYGGKSLAGSMGALITGTLVTFLYFGPLSPAATSLDQLHSTTPRYLLSSYNQYTSPVPLWIMAIYGGLVASISEGVSNLLWNLDDNLTIPVISAVLLWIPLIGFGLGL